MSKRKRSKDTTPDEGVTELRDHLACDQCRVRKTRCDKKRPQCSSCTRLRISCEWSGHGKKPNQAVLINRSISTIDVRLEQLERAVTGVQLSVQQLAQTVLASSDARSKSQRHSLPIPDSHSVQVSNVETPPALAVNTLFTQHHFEHTADGREHYLGPMSLTSLIQNINELLPDPTNATSNWNFHALSSAVIVARGRISQLLNVKRDTIQFENEGYELKVPPFTILEPLVDSYFDTVNPYMPIWTKSGFRRLMLASREGSSAPQDNAAYAICANNLVLLSLTAESLHSRATSSANSDGDCAMPWIDSDLIRYFVKNADRAVMNIEQLLAPRLVNVQALLSLCLTAQIHSTENSCSLMLNLAIQVAKSMGLHRWPASTTSLSMEQLQERRTVLYSLYFLDKTMCWSHGHSPILPVFDLNSSIPTTSVTELSNAYDTFLNAKSALALIEEQIYENLYSGGFTARSLDTLSNTIMKSLHQRLKNWQLTYDVEIGDDSSDTPFAARYRTQLGIYLCFTHMRLLWPFINQPETCRQLLENCRSCVNHLERLWSNTIEKGSYACLVHLFVSFPPIGLLHLTKQYISTPVVNDDIMMIRFMAKMLRFPATCTDANSYTARYADFAEILLGLAQEIYQQKSSYAHKYSPPNSDLASATSFLSESSLPDDFSMSTSQMSGSVLKSLTGSSRPGNGSRSKSTSSVMEIQGNKSTRTAWRNLDQEEGQLAMIPGQSSLLQQFDEAALIRGDLIKSTGTGRFQGTSHDNLNMQDMTQWDSMDYSDSMAFRTCDDSLYRFWMP